MKSKRNLLIVGGVVVVCLAVTQFATSIQDKRYNAPFDSAQGRGGNYRVEPEITTPDYKTDTGRVIDAYERLMDKYMDLAEERIGADCRGVTQKLESIDTKLTDLSARLSRIEKALGIDPNTQKPEPKINK